jgi:hypothetical protein
MSHIFNSVKTKPNSHIFVVANAKHHQNVHENDGFTNKIGTLSLIHKFVRK